MYCCRFGSRWAIPRLAAIMTYFAAILARPAPGQLPWADRVRTHRALRGTVMVSCVLPGQLGRRLDRLIEVLRMAIDDLWVDSRHDVLTPRSGAVP
jgi:hypothetical protein